MVHNVGRYMPLGITLYIVYFIKKNTDDTFIYIFFLFYIRPERYRVFLLEIITMRILHLVSNALRYYA